MWPIRLRESWRRTGRKTSGGNIGDPQKHTMPDDRKSCAVAHGTTAQYGGRAGIPQNALGQKRMARGAAGGRAAFPARRIYAESGA